MAQDELTILIPKEHWPKNVLRMLTPCLRKLGDSHGHIIIAAQPARGALLLKGPSEKIDAAKPGLRALIEEHFPEADIPAELCKESEQPEAEVEEAVQTDAYGDEPLDVEVPEAAPEASPAEAADATPAVPSADSAQGLAVKALQRAYNTKSASALRIALGAAYAAGVDPARLEEAEGWLKELSAAASLGSALQRAESVAEIQTTLDAARTAGVSESKLEEAELVLGRLSSQEALAEAMEAGREAQLREALAAARACGVEEAALAAAEAQLCSLAAECELTAATELLISLEEAGAVDEESEVAFAAAVREAATAGVRATMIAEAETRLNRLVAAREAQQGARRPAASEPSPKRRKTEPAEDGDLLTQWARRTLELCFLKCCKKRAVEEEDFDLAMLLKSLEPEVVERAERAKTLCQGPDTSGAADATQLEEVRRQKREAVEREDYDRAAELKALEQQLQSARQLEEAHASAAAARLLADSDIEERVKGFFPLLAEQGRKCPELWEVVEAELR
ncbi:unnamed protein product [Symbiodinium natans]|uniref:UVR domain-containing protein n=1 Tax=Symbiodinium natans TaxID=878477 RepID=A0A812NCJ1_9DINO|nr:unnamed protein product [Symbiodinium natans]